MKYIIFTCRVVKQGIGGLPFSGPAGSSLDVSQFSLQGIACIEFCRLYKVITTLFSQA